VEHYMISLYADDAGNLETLLSCQGRAVRLLTLYFLLLLPFKVVNYLFLVRRTCVHEHLSVVAIPKDCEPATFSQRGRMKGEYGYFAMPDTRM